MLIRPLNVLMIGIGTFLGGMLVYDADIGAGAVLQPLAIACGVTMLIGSGANAINDYYDVAVDAINRPERLIPSEKITRLQAWWVWLGCSVLGVLLSLSLSIEHLILSISVVVLMYGYSAYFKRTPLIGNILVGSCVALTVLFGAWVLGYHKAVSIAMFFAFMTTLVRELIKDLQDYEGDKTIHAKTLPLVWGKKKTKLLVIILLVLILATTPLPFLVFDFKGQYLFYILGANLCFLWVMWLLMINYQKKEPYGIASNLMKLAMVSGLLALAFGT